MNLPPISIPKIDLPFEVPVLLHPPVDHIAIALPIIILLIEVVNLFAKKRAISVLSLFLILLAVVASVAAYVTGGVDGKEAYPLLSEAGQAELKEHKLLGTYLMLASGVVLLFKLLSMISAKGILKAFYLLVLAVFVAGMLKQGKDGGELVYEFGANVEAVKALDDEKFDLQEELDELTEELESKTEELEAKMKALEEDVLKSTETKTEAVSEAVESEVSPVVQEAEEKVEAVTEAVKSEVPTTLEEVETKTEAITEQVN